MAERQEQPIGRKKKGGSSSCCFTFELALQGPGLRDFAPISHSPYPQKKMGLGENIRTGLYLM